MSQSGSFSKVLKWFFFLGALEGTIVLVWIMLIPADPKNAWMLGYSKSRLLMAGGVFTAFILFMRFALKARNDEAWLLKTTSSFRVLISEFKLSAPLIWSLFTLIYFSPYVYLWRKTELHPVILRITPLIVWGILLCSQTLILMLIVGRDSKKTIPWTRQEIIFLKIKPQKIAAIFGIITFLLILISISFNLIDNVVMDNRLAHFTRKMYLDDEQNIPTFFSSLMLLVIAALLGAITFLKLKEKSSFSFHWIILSLVFVFLSFDENVCIHEMLNKPVGLWLNPQGIFSFGWVVVVIPTVILFMFLYLRFFLHLPKRYKWLFALSAVCYLSGALGVELIGAGYTNSFGWDSKYDFIASVEEILEMTGLVILIYGLTTYIAEYYDQIHFVLKNEQKQMR